MSFARNFQLGMQLAGDAMDTYDQARLGKIIAETNDAKVKELAEVEDREGVPVDSARNQQPEAAELATPADGQGAPVEQKAPQITEPRRTQVSPKQYQFLGKTYDQPVTDEQMSAARRDSMKSRMSELFNPSRGLKQMRELSLQDQEDYKFGLLKEEQTNNKALREALGEYANADQAGRAALEKKIAAMPGGQKALGEFVTQQDALYKNRLNALTRIGLSLINEGNYQGLVDAYKHYNDGQSAVYVPGQNGGGTLEIYQGDPNDGKKVGAVPFKDKADLANQFMRWMDPVAALQSDAELAKERRKQADALELERAKGQSWLNRELIRADLRGGGSSGGGGGSRSGGGAGGGKPAADPSDAAISAFHDAAKEAGVKSLTESQYALGAAAAREAARLNPGIDAQNAGLAAVQYATDPKSATRVFNPATGSFDDAVKTDFGTVRVRGGVVNWRSAANMKPEDQAAAVETVLDSLSNGNQEQRALFARAAFDGGVRRQILDSAMANLRGRDDFKALDPKVQAQVLAAKEKELDSVLGNSLSWVSSYGRVKYGPQKEKQKSDLVKSGGARSGSSSSGFGLLSGSRSDYLRRQIQEIKSMTPQQLASRNALAKAAPGAYPSLEELQAQLSKIESEPRSDWWRGRASAEDSIAQ